VVKVRMTPAEIERLDALAAERGVTRSRLLRSVLESEHKPTAPLPELSRGWALERLQAAAADGSVTAMVALERALRLAGAEPGFQVGPIPPDEFDDVPELRLVP
jgi:hypothetical protein